MFLYWYLFVNTLLCLLVGNVAKLKGYKFANYFFLSFCFSFIVGILIVLALPAKAPTLEVISQNVRAQNGEKLLKCPYCAEWVKHEAKVCKHCGRDIGDQIEAVLLADIQSQLNKQEEQDKIVLEEKRKSQAEYDRVIREQQERKAARAQYRKTRKYKVLRGLTVLGVLALGVTGVLLGTNFAEKQRHLIASEGAYENAQVSRSVSQLDWKNNLSLCGASPDGLVVEHIGLGTLTLAVSRSAFGDLENSSTEQQRAKWINCLDRSVIEPGLQCRDFLKDQVAYIDCPLYSIESTYSRWFSSDNEALACDPSTAPDGCSASWSPFFWSQTCKGKSSDCVQWGSWETKMSRSKPLPFAIGKGLQYSAAISSPKSKDWLFKVIAVHEKYLLKNCAIAAASTAVIAKSNGISGVYPKMMSSFGPYQKDIDPEYAWFNDTNMDGVVCDGNDPMK